MSTIGAEPIAILGMGMRLPGAVTNDKEYWDLLISGKSGHCRVPKDRYNAKTWYGPGRVSHTGTQYGYFLENLDLTRIDSSFWSMSNQEAASMDPRQRLLLEVVQEAFENSGTTGWRGKDIGVYIGVMGDDWTQMKTIDELDVDPARADVFGDYIIANRISYEFDLKGPSMVLRTACSSSLTALHTACQDLRTGVCDSAIVGGANIILSPLDNAAMTEQGVLSPTGECKTFDATADGYGRGEGVSVIYIKRLSDALRNNDTIRAVIKATCVSGDGRTNGMTVPDPSSHERLIRKTYRLAGIEDISQTAMVECHGTGTPIGDPLEATAVANIWGDSGINIGSVKPNIGHGEGASGLSSVIKMVMALEKRILPPNINLTLPNPQIPWTRCKLEVPLKPKPWPEDRQERVSINSFGIGGSNAHVILESASLHGWQPIQRPKALSYNNKLCLMVLSAKHPDSLAVSAERINKYLQQTPSSLPDVAYTLSKRRETYPYRAFAVVHRGEHFNLSQVVRPQPEKVPKLVWVFTGQGAQWAQMGNDLIEYHPMARKRIDELDSILQNLPDPPLWTIRGEISKNKDTSRLYEAEFSQPCLAALQITLVDLLRSLGAAPDAVVGHSSGETVAAYASGAITAEEAMAIAYHRGQITPQLKASHTGGMCAVSLGRSDVEPHLQSGVIIGCENSPFSVTLSGDANVLQKVMVDIKSHHPEALVRALRVECGYHSSHMQTVASDYSSRLSTLPKDRRALIPFYSSVTGSLTDDLSPVYWVNNLVSPVLFYSAVQRLLQDFESPLFVELGPHSALGGPIRQILQEHDSFSSYIPTMMRGASSLPAIMSTAGRLWLHGIDIMFDSINGNGMHLTDLPTYSWHYDRAYWTESMMSRERRLRKFDQHELLGLRVFGSPDKAPMWRCVLRLEDVLWLRDHSLHNDVVFPATAYIAMVGEAVRQLTGSASYTVSEVDFLATLTLGDDRIEVVTVLKKRRESDSLKHYSFSIHSLHKGVWQEHVSGYCSSAIELSKSSAMAPEHFLRKVDTASFYDVWKKYGLDYRNSFRRLVDVRSHVSEAKATVIVKDVEVKEGGSFYATHPAKLDAALQLCMVASSQGLRRNFRGIEVPTSIRALTVMHHQGPMLVNSETFQGRKNTKECRIQGFCGDLKILMVEGLKVTALAGHSTDNEDSYAAAHLDWMPDISFLGLLPTRFNCNFGIQQLLQSMVRNHPVLRVLEIGIDVEPTRTDILESLHPEGSERSFDSYTYVALSTLEQSADGAASQTFPTIRTTTNKLQDLDPQVLKPFSYDLVVFDTPVEGDPNSESLIGIAKGLVKTKGYLLLKQYTGLEALDKVTTSHILGQNSLLPSYLARIMLKEESEPRYNFFGVPGSKASHNYIIAVPRNHKKEPKINISVVCVDQGHPVVSALLAHLEDHGFVADVYIIGQRLPRTQTVLCLLDIERPFLFDVAESNFKLLKDTLQSLDDSSMLWVTGASQIDCQNPNYALTLGFVRTIRREMDIDIITLELDDFSEPGWNVVEQLLIRLQSQGASSAPSQESEYVLSQGMVQISRFHYVPLKNELLAQFPQAPRHGLSSDGTSEAVTQDLSVFKKTMTFKRDRTYVLVGGLGGIGIACARFMVERGARHLLFFSRSAYMFLKSHPWYKEELEAMGCDVQAFSGHVDCLTDVKEALAVAIHPIAGVIHAAMILQDNNFNDMTFEQWQAAVSPKVAGTWNVHNALFDQPEPLDFFLLLSSLSGLGGQAGQANYAAANTFLDAFVQYRHGLGFACSVLDIGFVEDIGVLARETQRLQAFDSTTTHKLREQDVMDAIELMITTDRGFPNPPTPEASECSMKPAQLVLGLNFKSSAIPVGINARGWRNDPRMKHYWSREPEHEEFGPNREDTGLKELLRECSLNPALWNSYQTVTLISEEVGKVLKSMTMQPMDSVDLNAPLDVIGVDSLSSMELRNWIKRNVGVAISVPELLRAKNIRGIAGMMVRKLQDLQD
ncbi:Highly reducing polyketide synthase VdtX [Paramyrothecium foliicola]|nr:Highly reducing polyketide synthase VdtX [Paramyrothecium foliicola]